MNTNSQHHNLIQIIEYIGASLNDVKSKLPLSALIIIKLHDIDRINTSLNYNLGDALYSELGSWVRDNIRPQDLVLSLTHNKLAILLCGINNKGHAILAANKLLNIEKQNFLIDEFKLSTHATLGISLIKNGDINACSLMQNAEIALEQAIINNKAYEIYSGESNDHLKDDYDFDAALNQALSNDEFTVLYQPKVNLKTSNPCGAEALLRWDKPGVGFVSPELFLPKIEKSPYMIHITDFVLNKALRDQLEWYAFDENIQVSVNFSSNIIQQPKVEEVINRTVNIWGNNPRNLTLEITESSIMDNIESCFSMLEKLRSNKYSISIDDFGTGYSSFAYLKDLPADEIKIDKSFIRNLAKNPADYNIVRAIIELAHSFGFTVVAEGVEDKATAEVLIELECDYIQGYLYSKPLTQDDFITWLKSYNNPLNNKLTA